MTRKGKATPAATGMALETVQLAGMNVSENSASTLAAQRLARRFNLSAHLAEVIATHAGLGPQEARR